MPTLVLLRHGQSQWNLENRFTGWWDVDLSPTGVEEARAAGKLLRSKDVDFDCCFTSVLTILSRTSDKGFCCDGRCAVTWSTTTSPGLSSTAWLFSPFNTRSSNAASITF